MKGTRRLFIHRFDEVLFLTVHRQMDTTNIIKKLWKTI